MKYKTPPSTTPTGSQHEPQSELNRDVFDCIEFFYNPQSKQVGNGLLSPIDFEQQQKLKLQGVKETKGDSDQSFARLGLFASL